jgi:hypothetical protein
VRDVAIQSLRRKGGEVTRRLRCGASGGRRAGFVDRPCPAHSSKWDRMEGEADVVVVVAVVMVATMAVVMVATMALVVAKSGEWDSESSGDGLCFVEVW